jgi:hypothetical protein
MFFALAGLFAAMGAYMSSLMAYMSAAAAAMGIYMGGMIAYLTAFMMWLLY